MQVDLDIATDDATERADEIVHLSWIRATDSVRNTDAIDANLVDSLVDGQEVDQVRAEGVFRREADLNACRSCECRGKSENFPPRSPLLLTN